MANVNFIKGINYDDGNSVLALVYGNDVAIFSGGSWVGQSQNLVPGDYHIAEGKGYAYLTGLLSDPRVIDSSGNFSKVTNLTKAPTAAVNQLFRDRQFFGNCVVNGDSYYKRVFYTDIIEKDDGVVWGLDHGSDLSQTADSTSVTSAGANFISNGIKIGDPFIILDGNNESTNAVFDIVSETEIILKNELSNTSSSNKFIVGGNWFDIEGAVVAMAEHYGELLVYENNHVWRWSPAIGKKPLIGTRGTTSRHSIIPSHRGFTYWYHPSDGIVEYNGNNGRIVSGKIEPIIDSISDPTAVVGWPGIGKQKNHIFMYIGDTSFKVNGESYSLTNTIVDFNSVTRRWKVMEYNAVITCATRYIESNQEVVYLGTDSDIVLQFNTGNSDYDVATNDGSTTLPIHTRIISHPVYPSGIEVMNMYDKYYALKDAGTGIKSRYKLHGDIDKDDSDWSEMHELNEKYGEVKVDPQKSEARGISFLVSEISKDPSFEFLGYSFIYSVMGEAFKDDL